MAILTNILAMVRLHKSGVPSASDYVRTGQGRLAAVADLSKRSSDRA